ncbi:hypothetical protein [Streptomyces sp. NPDC002078]
MAALSACRDAGYGRRSTGELEEVRPLVVVQMEHAGENVQHGSGCLHTALLQRV